MNCVEYLSDVKVKTQLDKTNLAPINYQEMLHLVQSVCKNITLAIKEKLILSILLLVHCMKNIWV